MPSISSALRSLDTCWFGVAVPLRKGEFVPDAVIVGWLRMLNMDVTGTTPACPVWDVSNGSLLGDGLCDAWRCVRIPFAERLVGAELRSILGVGGPPSDDSLERPNSLSPRFSSSSSLIRPKTRRTMLPTTSSRGWAATRRFPTSWTRCMNFCGSGLRIEETIRRRRRAVAIAQGRECRICRRLSSLDMVSIPGCNCQRGIQPYSRY
jgi:hypothetical protein